MIQLAVFTDKVNLFLGAVTSLLAMLFGDFWFFFLAFFILNIVDYLTGWAKARYTHTENSGKGAQGIAKKVGYWVMIGISFFVSVACKVLGFHIGVNLTFLSFVGYFTLATYSINEIRSIVENLALLGVPIHPFFTRGLTMAEKWVHDFAHTHVPAESEKIGKVETREDQSK